MINERMKDETNGRKTRVKPLLISSLTVMALTFACASGQEASNADSDSDSEATGDVLFMGSGPQDVMDEVAAEFNDANPDITLQYINVRGPELLQRADAERAAGRTTASLLMAPVDNRIVEWRDDGHILEYHSANEDAYDPWFVEPGYWIGMRILVPSLVYNTDRITAPPESWELLADSEYRGDIAITPAGTVGGAQLINYQLVKDELGSEFWPTVADNDPVILEQTGQIVDQVISGELAAGWTWDYNALQAMEDNPSLPIQVAWLNPTALSYAPVMIPSDAPNPEAAKVAYDWLGSTEGQQAIANANQTLSAHPEVEYTMERAGIDDIPWEEYDVFSILEDQEDRGAEWNQVFDR